MSKNSEARAADLLRSMFAGLQDEQIAALASLDPSPAEIELAALRAVKGEEPVSPGPEIRMPIVERIYTEIRDTFPDDDR